MDSEQDPICAVNVRYRETTDGYTVMGRQERSQTTHQRWSTEYHCHYRYYCYYKMAHIPVEHPIIHRRPKGRRGTWETSQFL